MIFRRLSTIVRVAIGLGLLSWVLATTESWRIAREVVTTPGLILVLISCSAFGSLVEGKRLSLLLAAQNVTLPLSRAVRLVAIATFFNFFVPGGTGGDVSKLYALTSNRRGRRVEIALLVLIDRVAGLCSLLCLVTLLAIPNWQLVSKHSLIATLVAIAVIVLAGVFAILALSWSENLRAGKFYTRTVANLPAGKYLRRLWDALFEFRGRRGTLAAALGLSVVGHLGLCVLFLAVAHRAGMTAPAGEVLLLSLLGMLANALPLTPGGIGVGEAAFAALFLAAGYTGGSQLILVWRMGALLLGLVGGLLFSTGSMAGIGWRQGPVTEPIPNPPPQSERAEL